MNEYLIDASEELKRLEHTIHVTLKYTRTIDVLRNAVKRLIDTFDVIIEAFLDDAKEKELITALPKSPSLRSTLLLKTYPEDQTLLKFINFYVFLRDIYLAKYKRREEYRRHVTLVVNLKNKTAEVDIDNLETFEKIAFKFFDYAMKVIEGISDEDDEE